jgi:hypothetical protein
LRVAPGVDTVYRKPADDRDAAATDQIQYVWSRVLSIAAKFRWIGAFRLF